jgi:hypothetical protein
MIERVLRSRVQAIEALADDEIGIIDICDHLRHGTELATVFTSQSWT